MKRLLALAALVTAAPLLAAQPIEGRWMTAEKDAVITIDDCGSSLCGKITRFLVPPPQGADQRDVNNSNASLRNRKLLGMPVLTGFSKDDDVWRGQIYDPKSGKTYRSIVRRKSANQLEVKGCIGPFCQTQVWTKAR
ncbi:DUF2147 domain-containing protein [Qipengyuania psychrotolerans]|uniref:DUF2147 domain-containing protein n=1 Tax=Qipengyuania psychrotolerans TaxID=2867238 RepID=A0ABX8ZCV9_9SPHN|nr:DUF2147 domain-containing protein [Qipengyuania psychrotolerans]QZD86810.1 DUF2147 domain-containing protein [Qipengyuania psychrotolerans]